MSKKKRSPLTDKPLRYPGQSLDEEIDRIANEDADSHAIVMAFAVTYAGLEWLRWYFSFPYSPVVMSVMAAGVVAYSLYHLLKIRKQLKQLRLGRDGERVVGQYLDLLRQNGYRIFHDVVGPEFNIDHVIISEKGVFAVETKTYSKPTNRKAVIRFQSGSILVDGYEPDRNPIQQAAALADWLRQVLKESTGKEFPVKGVVLFPGWWIEGSGDNKNVWVLNPKALPTFLGNARNLLPQEDVQLATYHLSRFIRTH